MPLSRRVARFNKRVSHHLTRPLVGHATFAEVEHVGRRTGRRYVTPLNAFRDGDVVTVALTYGHSTDWLRNVRAAGGCRMRVGPEVLTLGPPHHLGPEEGRARVPAPVRVVLELLDVDEFVEFPVVAPRSPG
ncbi:MAG TPA: nitroreductase family deazaflavin-dependent oxidoreductase [Phycicoccus sp.]|nr:nitroreductase family deazaflavin-dependent oxidoreductase [Phycicoccus sp.]